ncbi:hypothetical protein F2Q68_00025828 [Brassica cretica]|uniref:No apical meristem-associated C-terminal domain-containing protein n=1 Tax=Brassica cretica TaxID=69181 RepID=A0A8S9IIP0_BRACR|nr:hypothetical protein F2Q68_00025828 [Brassica cretica]
MKEIQKNRRCLQRGKHVNLVSGLVVGLRYNNGGREEEDVAAEKLDRGQNCRGRDTCRFKKLLLQTRGDSRSNHRLRTRAYCNFIWAYLKWCELSTAKNDGGSKKRKCGDVSHSASSKATEVDSGDDDEATTRPPGVKAAKARSKKTMSDGKELSEFQTMWNIKQQDLALKSRLYKMKLLDSLITKQGPLTDVEEAFKTQLMNELMSP